jgi:carboxynorspermidine decarboxylase
LERTVQVVEEKFSHLFSGLKWFNFGGGHHVSRSDYDVERLCRVIEGFQSRTGLQVYMEPGEAIALNAGLLVGQVLDIVPGEENNVILDLSATAHMPDVLEMPYRPDIRGSGEAGEKAYTYQLGGLTCLAGDQIGDYSFDQPLKIGDRLVFEDMAHYTMVKNTTFNGVQLPAIVLLRASGDYEVVREFGYEDYRDRLS